MTILVRAFCRTMFPDHTTVCDLAIPMIPRLGNSIIVCQSYHATAMNERSKTETTAARGSRNIDLLPGDKNHVT